MNSHDFQLSSFKKGPKAIQSIKQVAHAMFSKSSEAVQ